MLPPTTASDVQIVCPIVAPTATPIAFLCVASCTFTNFTFQQLKWKGLGCGRWMHAMKLCLCVRDWLDVLFVYQFITFCTSRELQKQRTWEHGQQWYVWFVGQGMGPNNQKIRDSKHLKELSNGKLMKLYTRYVVENFKIQGFFKKNRRSRPFQQDKWLGSSWALGLGSL